MMDKGNLQQFMLLAVNKNLTNGDYIFIAVHPFATMETMLRHVTYVSNFVWVLPWTRTPLSKDATALRAASKEVLEKAFQSLFVLMPQVIFVQIVFFLFFSFEITDHFLKDRI